MKQHTCTLETDRLILRLHTKEDFDDRMRLWNQPDVLRFFGGLEKSKEEIWTKLVFFIGHWQTNNFGYWAVTLKETGQFIGEVGFMDAKRGLNIACEKEPETGWIIAPEYQHQGIASEALEAAHRWLYEYSPDAQPFCIITPENVASIKLAEKFGYSQIDKTEYKGSPICIFQKA